MGIFHGYVSLQEGIHFAKAFLIGTSLKKTTKTKKHDRFWCFFFSRVQALQGQHVEPYIEIHGESDTCFNKIPGFAIIPWNNPKKLEKPCITKGHYLAIFQTNF